ncbi:MAG: hypothetical protein ABIH87_02740 [bacterium]
MEEEKNIKQDTKENTDKIKKSGRLRLVLIIIGILIVLSLIYRVNNYWKYKKIERAVQKQTELLEKQGKEIQANYLKQINEVQQNILEQQQKLEEAQK